MEGKKHKYLKKIAQIKAHYMGYRIIYPEVYAEYVNGILDVVGARMLYPYKKADTIGIEVKVSRSDYRSLKQKANARKGEIFEEKELGCNYRYFLTPPNLISKGELYDGWGLMEFNGKRVKIVVKAPRKKVNNVPALFALAGVAHNLFHQRKTGLMAGFAFISYRDIEKE